MRLSVDLGDNIFAILTQADPKEMIQRVLDRLSRIGSHERNDLLEAFSDIGQPDRCDIVGFAGNETDVMETDIIKQSDILAPAYNKRLMEGEARGESRGEAKGRVEAGIANFNV